MDNYTMLKFVLVHPNAKLPAYAHTDDSGFDLKCVEDVRIKYGEITIIKTGLVAIIPKDYEIQIRPRSGLALKDGFMIVNSPGTIDAGYRGEICIIATCCLRDHIIDLASGSKVAQGVLAPVTRAIICETKKIEETDRGAGGFGSTGV